MLEYRYTSDILTLDEQSHDNLIHVNARWIWLQESSLGSVDERSIPCQCLFQLTLIVDFPL